MFLSGDCMASGGCSSGVVVVLTEVVVVTRITWWWNRDGVDEVLTVALTLVTDGMNGDDVRDGGRGLAVGLVVVNMT